MGSGEFESWSEEVERAALTGRASRVAIVPTASAPEGDEVFERWARMGLEHYGAMGVEARVVPLKRREDAERGEVLEVLDGVGMVFFSGGNPKYLSHALGGTSFLEALGTALDRGAVFAGCSAGAMVASRRPDARPRLGGAWVSGLGLIEGGSFGVHWDKARFIPGMRPFLRSRMRGGWFAGLDERTAILGDGASWMVYGLGTVELRLDGSRRTLRAGERFATPP